MGSAGAQTQPPATLEAWLAGCPVELPEHVRAAVLAMLGTVRREPLPRAH